VLGSSARRRAGARDCSQPDEPFKSVRGALYTAGVHDVAAWERSGSLRAVLGHDIFVVERRPRAERAHPVLILHGFPTCSFEWHDVIGALSSDRRVIAFDFLGFGLSAKPAGHRYSLFEQADIAAAVVEACDVSACTLITHDMGDSVGGELLARSIDGTLPFSIERRVLTNGSIYLQMAHLSAGQRMLLAMPDASLPEDAAPDRDALGAALAATCAVPPDARELQAWSELIVRGGGNRVLPRTIRYIEERREHEHRWTGAIERHPSPLSIVWGDADPIAVYPMAERLIGRRSDARLIRLEGVGHYPMAEAPQRFSDALRSELGAD
jgi:pimeloyl-ACP methyl ester carboxylesterase